MRHRTNGWNGLSVLHFYRPAGLGQRSRDNLAEGWGATAAPAFCEHAKCPIHRLPPVVWTRIAIFFLLACLQMAAPAKARAQVGGSEYHVKAAYLFNFLKFVEYPEDTFSDPLAPIVIGVVGDDLLGAALTQVVTGKTVQGRDIVVRNYRDTESLRTAHIVFISSFKRKKLPQILSSLQGSSVLTVADTDGFLEAGGMIQLFAEQNQVRFAINLEAATRARLKMSSKLLSVAKVVEGSVKTSRN